MIHIMMYETEKSFGTHICIVPWYMAGAGSLDVHSTAHNEEDHCPGRLHLVKDGVFKDFSILMFYVLILHYAN